MIFHGKPTIWVEQALGLIRDNDLLGNQGTPLRSSTLPTQPRTLVPQILGKIACRDLPILLHPWDEVASSQAHVPSPPGYDSGPGITPSSRAPAGASLAQYSSILFRVIGDFRAA